MLWQMNNLNGLWDGSPISPNQRVSDEGLEKDSKVILTCVQVQGPIWVADKGDTGVIWLGGGTDI